jgi:hypothetical protein
MSETVEPAGAGAVSFERAEFDTPKSPQLLCGFCKREISDQYHQLANRTACSQCRASLERELAAGTSNQSFLRAALFGAGAALAGCLVWILINKITGYELGLVAIGVGFVVGKAVRKGARGIGGPRYQYLAMFLTYSAIALASLPAIFEAIAQSGSNASEPAGAVGLVGLLWAWVVVFGFAYASPFLGGIQNIMGWFIIAIGLYEAWKLTRAVPIEVLGPFTVERASPVAEAAPEAVAPTADAVPSADAAPRA